MRPCHSSEQKGTTMDAQALRWIFGAACAAEGNDFYIPQLDNICCFDVDAVVRALTLSREEEIEEENGTPDAEAPAARCYHSRMEEELKGDILNLKRVHCALHGAMCISNKNISSSFKQ